MDQLERRDILLAAAGVALVPAALAASVNDGAAQTSPPVPPAVKITAAPIPTIKALTSDSEAAKWAALKARLKSYGNWPKTFDVSFESGAIEALKTISNQEKFQLTHNPRLVEPLLGDISSLLERCLSYRGQGTQLEIQGVAAYVNRVISDSTRDIDQSLTRNDPAPDVAAILASHYPNAAAQFRLAKNELGNANAIQLDAQTLGNAKIRDVETTRLSLSLARLQFVQDINRQLLGRYDVPGNGHNYAERFDRLRKLFESDITSAYRRALSAAAGLSALFDFKDAVPPFDGSDFLDDFVIWSRNAMRAVALIGESEIEIVRHVAINTIQSGAFKLNAGFGLVLVRSNVNFGPRPIIVIPAVRALGSDRNPESVTGGAVYNIDPRGEWSIRMSAKGVTTNNVPIERGDWVKGLVIKLRVVCVPSPENDGSWWTSEDRI